MEFVREEIITLRRIRKMIQIDWKCASIVGFVESTQNIRKQSRKKIRLIMEM